MSPATDDVSPRDRSEIVGLDCRLGKIDVQGAEAEVLYSAAGFLMFQGQEAIRSRAPETRPLRQF